MADLVAVRALVVDAVDEATAGFDERVGFTPNEANPLRLEILVKDLQQLTGDQMAVAPTKLDVHAGELVEIDGRRYELVRDKQGGLTLEPAVGVTVAELDRRHGTRPANQAEIADQLDLPPGDG